jgi:hypothetical protein
LGVNPAVVAAEIRISIVPAVPPKVMPEPLVNETKVLDEI